MELKLNIQNDSELRKHVKELIAGQVKYVVREEISQILNDVINTKIKDSNLPNIQFLIGDEVIKLVKNELDAKGLSGTSYVKLEARRIVNEYVKEAFSKRDIIS